MVMERCTRCTSIDGHANSCQTIWDGYTVPSFKWCDFGRLKEVCLLWGSTCPSKSILWRYIQLTSLKYDYVSRPLIRMFKELLAMFSICYLCSFVLVVMILFLKKLRILLK